MEEKKDQKPFSTDVAKKVYDKLKGQTIQCLVNNKNGALINGNGIVCGYKDKYLIVGFATEYEGCIKSFTPDNVFLGRDNFRSYRFWSISHVFNAKLSNSENIGKNLKPFDLEAVKQGKPVYTRDGRKARIICFDAKSYTPIIALVTADNGEELAFFYKIDGIFCDGENPDNDLVMLSEKHEGWVNVYNSLGVITFSHNPFDTKEEALATEMEFPHKDYVDTVKIEWEE